MDIDGDNKVGRFAVVEAPGGGRTRVVTDPGDSIAQAELLAAKRLIERLDSNTTRMGIVTFAGVERVPARIGASQAELLEALANLPDRPERGGTYFYGAIIASMKLLKQAPLEGGSRRHRSIILLSDGLPTAPPPKAAAEQAAVRAAEHASDAHITIYSFALGPEVAQSPRVFQEIADVNGGELMFVESPGDIVDFVPHMSLTKLKDVEIVNVTAGQFARAVRLFPDGTFDGFAPLVDGRNRLRIDIHGEAGGVHSIELDVEFEKTTDATRLRALLDLLRARTLETELAKEARRKRDRARERTLQIEIER